MFNLLLGDYLIIFITVLCNFVWLYNKLDLHRARELTVFPTISGKPPVYAVSLCVVYYSGFDCTCVLYIYNWFELDGATCL